MVHRPNAVSVQVDSDDNKLKFMDTNGAIQSLLTAIPETAGVVVAAKGTVVESGSGPVHKTVITLALTGANDLDLAGDADNSIGVKVYDFPAGRIHILGVVVDAVCVVNDAFNASANDVFLVSLGSADATQAANAVLDSTEADLLPSTILDTISNTTLSLALKAALVAAAVFDGTTTALDLFVNAAVTNASTTKAVTLAITGTITITWINLGDY
jgi:hypothetical protein